MLWWACQVWLLKMLRWAGLLVLMQSVVMTLRGLRLRCVSLIFRSLWILDAWTPLMMCLLREIQMPKRPGTGRAYLLECALLRVRVCLGYKRRLILRGMWFLHLTAPLLAVWIGRWLQLISPWTVPWLSKSGRMISGDAFSLRTFQRFLWHGPQEAFAT